MGSPCVADSGWVSFLAYPNLFGNKGFEEEEVFCHHSVFSKVLFFPYDQTQPKDRTNLDAHIEVYIKYNTY